MLRIVLLLSLIVPFSVSYAQKINCGTVINQKQIQYEKDHPLSLPAFPAPATCLNKTLSIYMHFVTDSLNDCGVTPTEVTDALAALNADFKPMCLQFKICQQDTIRAYKYDKLDKDEELEEIKTLYMKPNVINVFVMESINPGQDGGLASFSEDWILLTKGSFATPWKTWSHEMGHFFSLYHTFENMAFGPERVDRSNCSTAGDLLCDTEADYDPAPFSGCMYTGTLADLNNDQYTPLVGNIMSYHPGTCKTPFTVQQLNKMANYYITVRNYLY